MFVTPSLTFGLVRPTPDFDSDVSEFVFGGSLGARIKGGLLLSASFRSIDYEGTWGLMAGYLTPPPQ